MWYNDPQILNLGYATYETLAMALGATALSLPIGLICGLLLASAPKPSRWILAALLNMVRSLPFIVLVLLLMPLTRWLIGTTIGWQAALIPLSIGAIPLYARLTETAVRALPDTLFEVGRAMGATVFQRYWKLILPAARPALIRAGTTLCITLVGFSAMAGIIGGGGLGAYAYQYGFQRFNYTATLTASLLLIALVQGIQSAGHALAHRLERHKGGSACHAAPPSNT